MVKKKKNKKKLSVNAGNMDLIPGSGRALGEGNRNPLKYSCLGKPMEKEAWQAEVLKVKRVEHDLATKQQQQN